MVDDKDDKSSSSEYETDEEWEVERKIKQAAFLKDQVRLPKKYHTGWHTFVRISIFSSTSLYFPFPPMNFITKMRPITASNSSEVILPEHC